MLAPIAKLALVAFLVVALYLPLRGATAPQHVPLNQVDTSVCIGDGPAQWALQTEPGVYSIRCADGVTVASMNR